MNRKKSREKAMEILFGMLISKDTREEAIENFKENYEKEIKEIDFNYINKTIAGVEENEKELNLLIEESLQNWKIDRISKVNLVILKIALYEMKYVDEIPNKVAINEALDIARKYSDEKSVSFINGVLDKILKES